MDPRMLAPLLVQRSAQFLSMTHVQLFAAQISHAVKLLHGTEAMLLLLLSLFLMLTAAERAPIRSVTTA